MAYHQLNWLVVEVAWKVLASHAVHIKTAAQLVLVHIPIVAFVQPHEYWKTHICILIAPNVPMITMASKSHYLHKSYIKSVKYEVQTCGILHVSCS